MDYCLRRANKEDTNFLYELRNDELTRAMSINSDLVQYEDHIAWLEKTLGSAEVNLYILKRTDIDQRCGMGRVEHEDSNTLLLSWAIAPKFRGRGLASLIIKELIALREAKYCAYIKPDNLPSIKAAEKVGFVFKEINYTNNLGRYELNSY